MNEYPTHILTLLQYQPRKPMPKFVNYDTEYITSRVVISEAGCWEWQNSRDRLGYGQVSRISSGESLAHRLAWRIFVGDPSGKMICHSCDNPPCCNPEHLFIGTQQQNLDDARSKGRMQPKQPWKVTKEIASLIREKLLGGVKQRDIAKEHNISESHLSEIKHTIIRNTP